MKKQVFIAVLSTLAVFYSCKKKDNIVTNIDLIQHKWTYDSLYVYESPTFVGPGYKIPTFQGYTDFRTDGKMYTLKSLTFNGIAVSAYDTAFYTLKDNNTILSYAIDNGISAIKADTIIIVTLTDKILIANNLTNLDNAYGKFYLHR